MKIKEFLDNVCEEIKYKPIRNEICEELKNHIEEKKENYIEEGFKEELAEEKAIEQMGNAEIIGKKLNRIHRPKLDWKLLLIILIMVSFGFIIASTRANNYDMLENELYSNMIFKYISFIILGLVFSCIIYFINYKKVCKYSFVIYVIASIINMIAMFTWKNGNGISYFRIGTIMFSPAVITVPLYMIAFVGFLQNNDWLTKIKIFKKKKTYVGGLILLSIVSLGLINCVSTIASSIILGATYLIIATVKLSLLNKKKEIAILWGLTIFSTIIVFILMGGMNRIHRLADSLQPQNDPYGSGWLGMNQKMVISSAKLFGEMDYDSKALNIFDEGTNYAFISILAHYGWIIGITMITAIILLNIKLLMDAIKIKDLYGKLLIVGIASLFLLQSLFNLLMNFNLGMQGDFNIPLISYGGVNLIVNMLCLSLVLSIYRRKDINLVQVLKNS